MNKIGELRAISGHVLRAARVQIPQNNLDNLQSIREEEDGATEVSDPRDVPGSILLEVIDFGALGFLLETNLGTLGLLVYTLVTTCSGATTSRGIGTLRGTLLVAVNLVKGHAFPTKVKVLLVGFDPLALVEGFTHVKDNKGLLVTLGMFPDDVIVSTN
ncbi:hypothetical protein Tco_1138128 [Tanacetum coccineum]